RRVDPRGVEFWYCIAEVTGQPHAITAEQGAARAALRHLIATEVPVIPPISTTNISQLSNSISQPIITHNPDLSVSDDSDVVSDPLERLKGESSDSSSEDELSAETKGK
ncbi:13371_t:CDS:2, partial [Acaulospora colombiana]